MAVAGLGVSSLSACHAASPYAGAEAQSGVGSTCAKPTVIPMDPGNVQSGVTEGRYYVTNDSWNADGYIGLAQALHVCNYDSWYVLVTMNMLPATSPLKRRLICRKPGIPPRPG